MVGPSSPREHAALVASFAPRILRRAWIGGVAFAIGLGLSAAVALSTHRLYRSEAVVVYERGVQASSLNAEGEPPRLIASRLRDMATSRHRLEALIREMKLYPSIVDKRGLVEAIDEMRKRLALVDREGYTSRISYDGETRDLAPAVLTKLIEGVVQEDKQRRSREAQDTRKFLEAERRHADEDLKTKESALSVFLTTHPQLAAEVGGGASSGGLIRAADRDRASSSGGEVASLELQAAQLEASLSTALTAPRITVVTTPGAPPIDAQVLAARGRAQAELQAAQRDLAEKQIHLTNEHPDVKQALRRVALAEAADRRAEAASQTTRTPASGAAPAAAASAGAGDENGSIGALRRALGAVRQQISMVKSRATARVEVPRAVSSVVAIDTEWTRLNRSVTEARDRQNQLESKQFQAELAATLTEAGHGGQFIVTDAPFRPVRPIAGGRFKIAVGGLVGSLILALLAIGLAAAFDDRLYTVRDIDGILDDGFVVTIPNVPRKLPPKKVRGSEPEPPDGAASEASVKSSGSTSG